jgi:two-component system LytT family response regulator
MNVLVYVISVFILYAWFFIEQKEMFHQEMGSMKASLAAFQSKLQKRHESGAAGIADKIFNFAVKKGHQTIFISFEEIICVMSKGPYVQLVTDSGAHLLYSRLYEVQQKLPETFIRIHRSHIVNTGFIKGIRSLLNGDQQVLLKNGMEVRASRTYKERLRNFSS